MKYLLVVLIVNSPVFCTFCEAEILQDDIMMDSTITPHSRHPRYLVFPPRGAFKLVLGMAVPLDIFVKGKYLAWTINFQFQYQLPVNITELPLPPKFRSSAGRSLRAINRPVAYATLEHYMEGRGLHGRFCMLRSICEAATLPVHHDGLVGQILQIFLTPQTTSVPSSEYIHADYIEAQILGEERVDCRAAYPACKLSVLDLISQIYEV